MSKGNWGNTAQWISAAASHRQAQAMQNMSGAIAQQNALITAKLTKEEQIADARRSLLNIEEQFSNTKKTMINYPEYSSLILDDLENGVGFLLQFFVEFADIERARDLLKNISQVNQTTKNKFTQLEVQTQHLLKTGPQEISKIEQIIVAKSQVQKLQPRVLELEAGLKKRRKLAIIPLLLLLLLAPLSFSVYSTLPELPEPDDHIFFEMYSHQIYITHSDKDWYSMNDLANLNSNVVQLYFEYRNNTSSWSANYESLPSISALLELSMNSTNPELKSIDVRGFPSETAWPAEMRSGEVAVTPRNSSTIVQHLFGAWGYDSDGTQISSLHESQESKDCFEYSSHCTIMDQHTDYHILVNETGVITGFREEYRESAFYLYQSKVSGCQESIGLIQTHYEIDRGDVAVLGTGLYSNTPGYQNVKTEDNYEQLVFTDHYNDGIKSSFHRFVLVGVDNFIPENRDFNCFPGEDVYQPELLQFITKEAVYNENVGALGAWEPSGAEMMSIHDMCESILFPIRSNGIVVVEQPPECTKRSLSIPIIVTLVFTFMIAIMVRTSNEQKGLEKTEREWKREINLSGMTDKSVEELNQMIQEYNAVLQKNTPHLNNNSEVLNQEIQQQENKSKESGIWSNSQPTPNYPTNPQRDAIGIPDGKGYEWTKTDDGNDWYRVINSNSEWQRFEA